MTPEQSIDNRPDDSTKYGDLAFILDEYIPKMYARVWKSKITATLYITLSRSAGFVPKCSSCMSDDAYSITDDIEIPETEISK
jgi:hypothetical protein